MNRVPLVLLVLAAGCSFDASGLDRDAAILPGDAAADGRADARVPDAAPVGCQDDDACATPPDACHEPGTCNLTTGVCEFPPVDCTGVADACNQATCDPALGCRAVAAFEGETCAAPDEPAFSACAFEAACALTGSKSRTRTDYACAAGVCAPTESVETETCTRPGSAVEGDTCAPSECVYGVCEGVTECGTAGSRTGTCEVYTCTAAGACDSTTVEDTQLCTRDTDGEPCADCVSNGEDKVCTCSSGLCVPGMGSEDDAV